MVISSPNFMERIIQMVVWMTGVGLSLAHGATTAKQNELWYDQPAQVKAISLPWNVEGSADCDESMDSRDVWESETLPLGNGRVGATVYGGVHLDCVVLNEVSLWSGGRNALNMGAGYEYGPLSGENQFGSYQPFAQLYVDYDVQGKVVGYRRSLSLEKAVATCNYAEKKGDEEVQYRREYFVSKPDDVFVYHAEAETGGVLNARVALMPYHTVRYKPVGSDGLCMIGTLRNGEKFEGRIIVFAELGEVRMNGKSYSLQVKYAGEGMKQLPQYDATDTPYVSIIGARKFTILVSLATDYKMDDTVAWKGEPPDLRNQRIIAEAVKYNYKELIRRHTDDFSSLFNRLRLEINGGIVHEIPTNERLERYRKGVEDPNLEQLVFQYGRYLMISGSRPGNLPMNLQGLWNNKVSPPWASDYHTNINLEMCYWSAEEANLSECHEPLLEYLNAMRRPLSKFTRQLYGEDMLGWVTRISLNPWGGVGWMMCPTANAWFALHYWEHYQFTGDTDFLREKAYPLFKEICRYWEHNLKELGSGGTGLVSDGQPIDRSLHPELNDLDVGTLVVPNGWSHEWGPVEDGVAHDQQLVRELFKITTQAAQALHLDSDYAQHLQSLSSRLAPDRIGSGGYLQEWIVDRPAMVSGHRHTSHLFALFPGSTISRTRTPELAKAAEKSLKLRGLNDDNRRSWTWPWRAALYARLHDAESAYGMLQSLLRYNMLDNLLTTHPPMQLDGSLGIPRAVCEMLIQSHEGYVELLPALPMAWKDGKAVGLRARGNLVVDMEWKDGKVVAYAVHSSLDSPSEVRVVVNGSSRTVTPHSSPERFTRQNPAR